MSTAVDGHSACDSCRIYVTIKDVIACGLLVDSLLNGKLKVSALSK